MGRSAAIGVRRDHPDLVQGREGRPEGFDPSGVYAIVIGKEYPHASALSSGTARHLSGRETTLERRTVAPPAGSVT